MCISAFRPFSSPSNSLVILFIHSAFSSCFLLPYFSSKLFGFFFWPPVVGMFSCHLPVVNRIFFRCFGVSCFVCIVLPFVAISLIFLLSPVLSGLFPQVLLLFLLVLPFPFCSYIFQRFSFVLSFWPVFVDFLSAFPILVLIFFFWLFEGVPIFSQIDFD